MRDDIVRFSPRQRLEHLLTMVLFSLLCLTGLPQKFYTSGWAQTLIQLFGGIDQARWIHRCSGWTLGAVTALHATLGIAAVVQKKCRLSIAIHRGDFEDAVATLQYYLGLRKFGPLHDRFDYKQKFEYWALLVGNILMVLTGIILIYPAVLSRLLPGALVPAAKVAHSNEGLMAFLVITIWHIYNAHLNPDVFPIDTCIFSGRISRDRMMHEHPLELARLESLERPAVEGSRGGARAPREVA